MQLNARKSLRLIGALGGKPGGWYISPNGFNLYRVDVGDTIESLARLYLQNADRGGDIWLMQSKSWRSDRGDDESHLRVGDELLMPQEAIDNARAFGLLDSGGKGAAPSKSSSGKTEVGGTDVLTPRSVVTPSAPQAPRPPQAPHPTAPVPVKPAPAPPAPAGLARLSLGMKAGVALASIAAVLAGGAGVAAIMHRTTKKNPAVRRRGMKFFTHPTWG